MIATVAPHLQYRGFFAHLKSATARSRHVQHTVSIDYLRGGGAVMQIRLERLPAMGIAKHAAMVDRAKQIKDSRGWKALTSEDFYRPTEGRPVAAHVFHFGVSHDAVDAIATAFKEVYGRSVKTQTEPTEKGGRRIVRLSFASPGRKSKSTKR